MARKDRDDRGPANFLFGFQARKPRRAHSPTGTPAPKVQPQLEQGLHWRQHHAMQTKTPSTFGVPPVGTGSHLITHPFNHLASVVKQCPWMLGSDIHPFATRENSGGFYPLVPRSFMHDTAISFVLTDYSRPGQPQFVISCPLEHVNFVQSLLAPEGSQRQLTARGSSGHPRGGDQLRSMLLDGIPNIELAMHGSNPEIGIPNSSGQPPRPNDSSAQGRHCDPYRSPHPLPTNLFTYQTNPRVALSLPRSLPLMARTLSAIRWLGYLACHCQCQRQNGSLNL